MEVFVVLMSDKPLTLEPCFKDVSPSNLNVSNN